ncbi:GNAT family N-acetyltransferase [Salinimicrobium sediminilitoris]|uniref:GNAT family N-acetyltransferase n=1 Tax=Salinimicrobium sediminilitoris TaxID=2876715 RepID=UPI001E2BF854|nr:GNAT family protein [Salinimicrobium sediminilitoris]MCC8359744.1 GNAT family N-acetyltransferase [Salinimicrobium sediminilitoris]
MDFPNLTTSRLNLRQITEDDLQNIYNGLSHPKVIKYYGVNYSTLEETWEQLEWYAELERTHSGIWWAIISTEDEEFCGAIGFNNLSREHKKAELGFWLLPKYWGRGYVQESMEVVLDHGFGKLDLHRIEAFVETENISSQKALEKQHFQQEGIMRDSEIKDGRFISVVVFSKLKK